MGVDWSGCSTRNPQVRGQPTDPTTQEMRRT